MTSVVRVSSSSTIVAEPVEYEGIHVDSSDASLLFPAYHCDPTDSNPGLELTFGEDYRKRLEGFRGAEAVIRVEVRLRGMLSAKGRYGPDGRSPHRVSVVEILEMGDATVCDGN